MNNNNLKEFRESMGLKQDELAARLDIALNTYQNYERGFRYMGEGETREVLVPKAVALACAAIKLGITEYNGEDLTIE